MTGWLDPGENIASLALTHGLGHGRQENNLEFKIIVTNVAIAHVTIAHEDDQIKAPKK